MKALVSPACAVILLAVTAQPAAAQYSDAQIRQGLLANAWCSFSYNKTTGYSKKQRAVFSGDGSLNVSSGAEGGSSGAAGSYYGQSQGGDRYQWQVQGGQLMLGQEGQWETFGLDAKQNSNGSIILIVDGVEWSAC